MHKTTMFNIRDKLWYSRNCLSDDNIEYIETMCRTYGINSKVIPDGYGENALILTCNMDTYKVEVNKDEICLNLLKRNHVMNLKQKEYYHFVKSFKEDAWCECLKFIVRNVRVKDAVVV